MVAQRTCSSLPRRPRTCGDEMRRLLETVRVAQVRPGAAARRARCRWSGRSSPPRSPSSPHSPRRRPATAAERTAGPRPRLDKPERFAIYLDQLEETRYILTSVTVPEGGHARSPKEHAMHPELLSALAAEHRRDLTAMPRPPAAPIAGRPRPRPPPGPAALPRQLDPHHARRRGRPAAGPLPGHRHLRHSHPVSHPACGPRR